MHEITQEELAEIKEYAHRRNDDLLQKLLTNREWWIKQCAKIRCRCAYNFITAPPV